LRCEMRDAMRLFWLFLSTVQADCDLPAMRCPWSAAYLQRDLLVIRFGYIPSYLHFFHQVGSVV
jgi:hypothetical protein